MTQEVINPLSWTVYSPSDLDSDVPCHAVPDNDSAKHFVDLHGACGCNPWVDDEADDLIFVHNSFDGRELYAQGIKKPH